MLMMIGWLITSCINGYIAALILGKLDMLSMKDQVLYYLLA
jgi:hypothetical protein